MPDSPVVIEARGLGKSYPVFSRPQDRLKQMFVRGRKRYFKEFWALRDVNFQIRRGETVGVIGRNGAGKSTLLKMLCGTLSPTTGTFNVNGRVAALLELGTGFNPEFTGRENVYLNASILGLTDQQIDARFDAIVDFAEIGDFLDQPLKTYSSGMKVRLAFAVATHVDADILVVDEALSVGDAYFVQKCMRFMRHFIQHGTLIFVSHDTGSVTNLCQTALLLDGGRVVQTGAAKDVCERYLDDVRRVSTEQEIEEKSVQEEADYERVDIDSVGLDQRMAYINSSNLRNDIEAFAFEPPGSEVDDSSLTILDIFFSDTNGRPLKWVVGGEQLALTCRMRSEISVDELIVGFYVKDRLGQHLFGENTYLAYRNHPVLVRAGSRVTSVFHFRMPMLPLGDYTVDVAVARGPQQNHRNLAWFHDALVFKSHSDSYVHGLVGIPVSRVVLDVDLHEETVS